MASDRLLITYSDYITAKIQARQVKELCSVVYVVSNSIALNREESFE